MGRLYSRETERNYLRTKWLVAFVLCTWDARILDDLSVCDLDVFESPITRRTLLKIRTISNLAQLPLTILPKLLHSMNSSQS